MNKKKIKNFNMLVRNKHILFKRIKEGIITEEISIKEEGEKKDQKEDIMKRKTTKMKNISINYFNMNLYYNYINYIINNLKYIKLNLLLN